MLQETATFVKCSCHWGAGIKKGKKMLEVFILLKVKQFNFTLKNMYK